MTIKKPSGVKIKIPKKELNEFCQRNRIQRLALFGSVLGNNFRAESDVDVLVSFQPDAIVEAAQVIERFIVGERNSHVNPL